MLKPALTLMTIFENVPLFEDVGVPESLPLAVLKLAHDGLCDIENLSVVPRGPLALGVKLYFFPATTVAAGEPEMMRRCDPLALATPAARKTASAEMSSCRASPGRWILRIRIRFTLEQ